MQPSVTSAAFWVDQPGAGDVIETIMLADGALIGVTLGTPSSADNGSVSEFGLARLTLLTGHAGLLQILRILQILHQLPRNG